MSIHGNHWSFPKLTAFGGQMRPAIRPQSRPPSVATFGAREGSSLTRVGPIHVVPPSFEVKKKTSVLELTRWPLRLSEKTRYRSSANSPPRRSATMLPPELTRKHEFVRTARWLPWPRRAQSWRFPPGPERG